MARQTITSVSADVAALAEQVRNLTHTVAALVSITPPPSAKAAAPAGKAASPKATPKGSDDERCTAIKPNGKRCGGRGAARGVRDGLCDFHRDKALRGHVARVDDEVVVTKAAPVAAKPAAPKAPSGTGEFTHHTPGVTCKGVTKAGTACQRDNFLNADGWCKSHADQASAKPTRGRSVVAKSQAPSAKPNVAITDEQWLAMSADERRRHIDALNALLGTTGI